MIISLLAAAILFVIAIGLWWYLFFGKPNPPLARTSVSVAVTTPLVDGENPPLAEKALSVDGVTFNVEIAASSLEQSRGLSYRPSLGENDGMLFQFGSGNIQTFWMQGMNFPLDMIWISGTTIVGFAQNVPAPAPGTQIWQLPIYSSPNNTDKVLEVSAGTVAKYNIKVGDVVTIGKS